jgi:hypothetical protein
MEDEIKGIVDLAIKNGYSQEDIKGILSKGGFDPKMISLAVTEFETKKKSPSQKDLEALSLDSEQKFFASDISSNQPREAAVELYNATVKGNLTDSVIASNPERYNSLYNVYRQTSSDPSVRALPASLFDENGKVDSNAFSRLRRDSFRQLQYQIDQDKKTYEEREGEISKRQASRIPVISPLIAGAESILGGIINFAGEVSGSETLSDAGSYLLEDVQLGAIAGLRNSGLTDEQIDKGFLTNVMDGDIGTGLSILGPQLLQQIPQLALIAATGGTAGITLLGASSAGSALESVEKRKDMTSQEKMLYGVGAGLAESLSERLFMGDIRMLRQALGKAGVQDLTKEEIKQSLFAAVPQSVRSILEEGTEEAVASVVQQGLLNVIAGDEINPIEIAEGAIIGGIMGGSTYLLSKGMGSIGSSSTIKERAEIKKDINDIQQSINDPKTSEAEKDKLEDLLFEANKRRQDIEDLDATFYSQMTEQERIELYDLNKDLTKKARAYKTFNNEKLKRDILSDITTIKASIKEIENRYDTQEEAGIPSPIVEGEAPVEVQPIEGASQETPQAGGVLQVPVEEGAEVTAPIQATVFAAPFYDTKVNNIQDARAIRQSEPYINNLDTVRNASALFNLEIENIDESIGGFVNEAGDKIVEISNIIRVKGTPEDVQNYAAFLATSSPETQEATIAATYVEPDSEAHNIDELTISVSDVDGAIEALKENDIYDFTINDSNNTITFLDFSKGADGDFMDNVGKFAKSLERKNISYEKRDIRAIDSKYIGPREREGIFSRIQETLVQQGQTGTELYKQVEQAIARNQEFLAKTSAPISEAIVAEEITEQVVEQEPIKNKKGLSSEQVTEAVSGAERLAKRLGLPTKIIVHNSRRKFNDAMDEVSKSGSVASGVESGRFIPSINEIHLNLEDMTSEVPFHEVFHAAFVNRFAKRGQKVREKVATDFYNGIVRILRSGSEQDQLLADAVESFTRSGYYTAEEKPEEFLAQTAGFLSTSGDKISKSTMDKLIQWLNNFIAKVAPGVKINTRGEFIDFMNSFSGALFESSTEKSLEEIAEGGSYTPAEPAVMPDLSESASRFNEEKAPSWLKNNIANLKSLAGRKIPFAVFYDNTRVGKSTLKNKVTGKESGRNLMGGFGYSQLEGVKFEDDGAKVAVLAFTNEDMAARKLSEYLRKEGDLIPVAMQNTQTGHLGNLDVVYEMFDDVNGVVSTAPALYAEQQTGKKSGPEFEAARKAAEDEILGAIKQSVVELSEKTEVKKKPDGTSVTTDRVKAAQKIRPMLDEITTLAEWRDKILLKEWDSFGTRGLFNSYLLQAKPSKITKSTRETHKILHRKYGVPTVKEIEDGITEEVFSNAELGDVIKFVSPDKIPVIYTTDPIHKDLPKEGVQKKSDKITYTLKYIGNQVDAHVSYPYILSGENDGFAPSYIDITEIFPDLRGKVKKSQSFYAAGRRSLTAPVGELEIKESSSRDVREEILDKEQISFKQRAVNTAKTFVWSDTQKQIRVFKERMSSQLSVEGREIKKFTKGLNQLLKKADVQTIDLVGNIFDGTFTPENQRILESKPNGSLIFGQANAMRNYLDSFSEDFVNSPEFHALPEETVNTIIDNFGQYMRGSYRFWKDKNFNPSNAARRDAIAYEYEILRSKKVNNLIDKEGFNEDEAGEFFELLHDETLKEATKAIDDYISDIEKIRNGSDFKKLGIISPSSIKLPSEQFLRRKELPETIQNLLGKERDPIIRFIDTTIALSNIKYKGHMLYAISESLGGTEFIKNEVTDAEKSTGEYKEVKDKFSPLNGRFVHRDVYEAITNQNIYESDNIWMSGYLTTLQLARKSKVIYNLPTWRKNLTGGWYTMAANGVINPSIVKDFKRRAELFAKGETDTETEALIKIMGDNGLIGQDVNANLLGFTNAIYSRTLTGNDNEYTSYVDRARNLIKNFDSVVGQKYAAVDDYTKLVVFRSEIQSFAKKIYGESYDSLTEAQKNKVHAEAAEFVKQNTPTFSRLPRWYASLAKLPAGDFLSFEFESLRSFSTNIRNGQQDLMKGMNDKTLSKEQKAEYIKSGSRRLAGSAAIMGARLAITSILASLALGDDDELEEDIKNNRPNWMEGHSIIPTKVSKEGIATVYDYSMEDPYGSFFDLATDPLSFPAYVVDLLQPNMGISFLTNLAENKDFYGRDITNSYDSKLTKGYKYGGHTLKSLIIPPFIASSYRDEQKRLEAEADKYSPLDAVGRFATRAVIRDYEYNIPVQFYYFTDKFRTKKEQYSDLTGASRENRLAELDEIKKMYKSITNIGIKKDNFKIIVDANKNIKRALKPYEEAYVLYGYEIPEKK